MILNQVFFSCCLFFFIHILPSWNYELESCCSNEKTLNNNTRLLSCPVNFLIKLRTVNFYTGNGCARSPCQKRLNKHYLACNNHRTCSISIRCIFMDSSICPRLPKVNTHSQYLSIEYDCIVSESESPLIGFHNTRIKKEQQQQQQQQQQETEKVLLFSAKVNIESPPDLFNDSLSTEDEDEWKEFFLKKYLHGKQVNDDKTIIIQRQRSLLTDILRTVLILIIFAFILIVLMLIALFTYKRIKLMKKRELFGQEKHQPFPADDAYDNLKTTTNGSTTDV